MRRIQMSTVVATAVIATLGGCANILDKPYQKVYVTTPGVEGADCLLKNDKRSYRVITPGTLVLDRSAKNLHISCEKPYYFPAEAKIKHALKFWPTALNVTNGVVPGVAYDTASNAVWSYPQDITIPMEWDEAAYQKAHDDFVKPVSTVQKKAPPPEPAPAPAPDVTEHSDKAFDKSLRK